MDMMAPDEAAADRIAAKQAQAMKQLAADQLTMGLTSDEIASMAMFISSRPGVLTPYLCLTQEDGRRAFIHKMIRQQEEREL